MKKKVTISLPEDMQEALEEVKEEVYKEKSKTQMYRELIQMGLKRAKEEKEKQYCKEET